jgi:hypothetical protein
VLLEPRLKFPVAFNYMLKNLADNVIAAGLDEFRVQRDFRRQFLVIGTGRIPARF